MPVGNSEFKARNPTDESPIILSSVNPSALTPATRVLVFTASRPEARRYAIYGVTLTWGPSTDLTQPRPWQATVS